MEKSGILGIADGTNSSSLYFLEKRGGTRVFLRIFFLHDMKTFSMRLCFYKENLKEILDYISSLEKLSNEDYESGEEEEFVYRTVVNDHSNVIVICKCITDDFWMLNFIGSVGGRKEPFDYAQLKFFNMDNDRFNQFKNDLKEIYENWEE